MDSGEALTAHFPVSSIALHDLCLSPFYEDIFMPLSSPQGFKCNDYYSTLSLPVGKARLQTHCM